MEPPASPAAAATTATTITKLEHDGDDDDMWFDEGSQCNDSKEELIGGVLDLDREWSRRHDQFHTIGYRDGLTSGKEASAQEGFTIGFKQSVLVGYKFGIVRGVIILIYALGGYDGTQMVPSVEVFDPRTGSWMAGDEMKSSRGYSVAAVIGETLLCHWRDTSKQHSGHGRVL